MKLNGRTILITGGTSGIGLELATQLSALDNRVIVTGRSQSKLERTLTRFPKLSVIESDVSDPNEIRKLHGTILQRFPNLDTLVNNAGIMRNLNLTQQDASQNLTSEIETNLNGPIRMIQQFLPHLKSRGDGAIINVSSMLAFVPYPSSPVYSATKAALHSYTQSLRVQLSGSGMTVIELAPPGVRTPLFEGEFDREMEGQKLMDVQEFAKTSIKAIERGTLEIRPGLSNIIKLLSRLAPETALRQMVKSMRPKTVPSEV